MSDPWAKAQQECAIGRIAPRRRFRQTFRAALAEGLSLYSDTRAFSSAICLYKPALQHTTAQHRMHQSLDWLVIDSYILPESE